MASKEIKPHVLNKDELIYEVSIRSESPLDTVSSLRKQLRSLLTECPSDEITETELEPIQEIANVEQKIKELHDLFNKYKQTATKALETRLKTLAYHIYFRLGRIQPEDLSSKQKVNSCNTALSALLEKIEQPITDTFQEDHMQDLSETQDDSASGHSDSHIGAKCVAKWNIHFNGSQDPRSFLDRVEDLRRADGVADDKLLNSAARLFVGQALIWFRAVRSTITTWSQLRTLLLDDFSVADYDYKLLGEIRLRTQGAEEPLHIYFSIMKCMFDRLRKPLPETEQLDILLRNIRPFYSQQLAFVRVTTVDDLLKKCKVVEVTRQRCSDFSEPDNKKFSVLTSEFLYKPKSRACSSVSSLPQAENFSAPTEVRKGGDNTDNNSVRVASVSTVQKLCFKCGKPNHNFRSCRKNDKNVCYACGKAGHFIKDCPVKKTSGPVTKSKN